MADDPDLTDAITEAAADPQRVSVDGVSADARPLKDLIEADKYLKQQAATKKGRRGFRISKMIPPGTA